jgi:O-acetyl-ADP-ribose deacetylase (regulator of RNase III)
MVSEARRFLETSKAVKQVGFVLYDETTYEIFKREVNLPNPPEV